MLSPRGTTRPLTSADILDRRPPSHINIFAFVAEDRASRLDLELWNMCQVVDQRLGDPSLRYSVLASPPALVNGSTAMASIWAALPGRNCQAERASNRTSATAAIQTRATRQRGKADWLVDFSPAASWCVAASAGLRTFSIGSSETPGEGFDDAAAVFDTGEDAAPATGAFCSRSVTNDAGRPSVSDGDSVTRGAVRQPSWRSPVQESDTPCEGESQHTVDVRHCRSGRCVSALYTC